MQHSTGHCRGSHLCCGEAFSIWKRMAGQGGWGAATRWLRGLVRLLGLAWLLAAGAVWAVGDVQVIRRAERAPAGQPSSWEPVTLPDSWNPVGREGIWLYRLGFELPASGPDNAATDPMGLYLPRTGNRIRVSLNGHVVGAQGWYPGSLDDHGQRPHFFFLPAELLRPGRNELGVEVQGEKARYAGLSTAQVGPAQVLLPLFRLREAGQVQGSSAIVLLAMVFAAISGALAWSRRDPLFILFSVACVCSVLRHTYGLVVDPPLDYRWWSLIRDAAYAGYLGCLCAFSVRALGLHQAFLPWLNGALVVASVMLIPVHALGRIHEARKLWLTLMVVYGAAISLLLIWNWYQRRGFRSGVMAAAGSLSLALGIHDHVLVFYSPDGYSAFVLVGYSLLVYLLAMAWLLMDHQVRQLREQDRRRLQLEFEHRQREAEMAQEVENQRRLVAERAQRQERQRIFHDVHDGLGLQLNALLRRVETGAGPSTELAQSVRLTIEELRLLVDNAEVFEGDIAMLMAQIRHQIERQFRQAGIRLHWACKLNDPDRRPTPKSAATLQRVMQELAGNVLKHAQASEVRVTVLDKPDVGPALMLTFEDNGVGYAEAARKQGPLSVQRRVRDLSGHFSLEALSPGSRHRVDLPDGVFQGPAVSSLPCSG